MNPYVSPRRRAGLIRLYMYVISLLYVAFALLSLPSAAAAQATENSAQPPAARSVAVYVTGGVPDYQKDFLGAYMLEALVDNGNYEYGENADALIAAMNKEQSKRKAPLNDSAICESARQFGVRYVCAVSVTPAPSGVLTLSARIISTKTGNAKFHGETAGQVKTMGELAGAADELLKNMFDKHTATDSTANAVIDTGTTAVPNSAAEDVATVVTKPEDSAETVAIDTNTTLAPNGGKPNIAVYVTGDAPGNEKKALGTHIFAALVNSGRYNGIERTDDFISAIDKEQATQRSGAIDDKQISQIGIQYGVKFVCIADITSALGAFQVSARIVNVETAEVAHIGQATSPLATMEDLTYVSDKVVRKMFNLPEPPETDPLFRKPVIEISVGAGGLIAGGYGGGFTWKSGERVKMPYSVTGIYLFFDGVYAELFFGYASGNGKWESPNVGTPQELPYMPRTYINAGLFAKYPFEFYGRAKAFPLVGLDYEASISGKIKYGSGGDYVLDGTNGRPDANSLSSLWFKFGAGADFALGKTVYLRSELIYGLRAANDFERFGADRLFAEGNDVWAELGQSLALKIGVGAKF